MLYVTDTHPFLWHLSNDKRLGKEAKSLFDRAERGEASITVPTIVLAEAFYIAQRHRLKIEFSDVLERVENALNFPVFSLDINVIRKIQELDKLQELHDKIIVATARILDAHLITNDREIRKSEYVKTVW
jgi:predicted nucleic acid-binding protein